MSAYHREGEIMKPSLLAGCALLGALFFRAPSVSSKSAPFPDPLLDDPLAPASVQRSIVVAGGCFWGVQAVFQHVNGVVAATSGYAGGTRAKPSYDDVSSGETGHAESVRVVYDPSKVSLAKLLDVFFTVAHDPTQLNRQGPDHGT